MARQPAIHSSHWFIPEAAVTIRAAPRTIHDFGGFPTELYHVLIPRPEIRFVLDAFGSCSRPYL